MLPAGEELGESRQKHNWFATTHWSVVLGAADTVAPQAQEALETLCRTYWYPLYAYVRRQGHSPEDAQDLTQSFFQRFLEKKYFQLASRERGRFRTFLLSSLKNFLINEWERARATKRGGGATHIPLDGLAAENHYIQEAAHNMTAEKIYERNWAMAVLERVRTRLKEEYATGSRAELFPQLELFLPGQESELTYAEAARRLGMAEGTLKSEVNRFKKRYRELLRVEIAHTVSSPVEINDELRHLIAVLGGS